MIRGNKLKAICDELSIDIDSLPDKLNSTVLKAIAEDCGYDGTYTDDLYSTILHAACEAKSIDYTAFDNPNSYTRLIDALYTAIVE